MIESDHCVGGILDFSGFIAHVRKSDGAIQTVETHLLEASEIAGRLSAKLGLTNAGALIGLFHDLGKFSNSFQSYIKSCVRNDLSKELLSELSDFDADSETGISQPSKKRVDHSTAGAQWIQKNFLNGKLGPLGAQIMNLCVVSHHGGLIDSLDPDGKDNYDRRISKSDEDTHYEECQSKLSQSLLKRVNELNGEALKAELNGLIRRIFSSELIPGTHIDSKIREFFLGCLVRCLFSCLVDADRISSADFEEQKNVQVRSKVAVDWSIAASRFEQFLAGLEQVNPIDKIRRDVSDRCMDGADSSVGVFSLTVPTGGGKTYASLRFAIHHARKHNLERIFYIIPYTSIIEQNALEIRKILEIEDEEYSSWVLEHHSNLEPEQQTWQSKLIAENWDAPIVVTTMVQFLEAWFGSGTRSVRRLHQLAQAVLIFDEIQTLPVKCVHMFCNAMNFLTIFGNSSVVLCTATQPVLNQLRFGEKKGELLTARELMGDADEVRCLFDKLERVEIVNQCKAAGWSLEELTTLAIQQLESNGSCLFIVNTKAWARDLYLACKETGINSDWLFHLSTNQCPAHRKFLFEKIKKRLKNHKPVLCVSTQLIEAGVDISFNSGIRFLAGLDSIAQAAGRINRHGLMQDENGNLCKAKLYVVNPAKEPISRLEDILQGQRAARRVLDEAEIDSMLKPETVKKYFQYYFFERSDAMVYRFKYRSGKEDTIFNLLSDNPFNIFPQKARIRQSFATANKEFAAIAAPTKSVVVPYGDGGRDVIARLCSDGFGNSMKLALRDAQKFSVNVFPHVWQALLKARAVYEIPQTGVFYLDEQYYNEEFGLATTKVADADFLWCE